MNILNVKQNSVEWEMARLGVVTASEMDELISPEGKPRTGDRVEKYLAVKLTERVLGMTGSIPNTFAMDNGAILEREALPYLEFAHGWKIDRVGFCISDDKKIGCSPDGLIGEDGGVEIKCPLATTHVRYLMEGELPKIYRAQVNMSLYVTGRKWWQFVSYNRHLPPLILRVERNEQDMEAIARVLGLFLINLDYATLKLKAMMSAGKENKP